MEDEDMKKKIIIAAMAGILAVVGAGATTGVAKAAGNEETAIATESGDSSIGGSNTTISNDGYVDSNWSFALAVTDDRQKYPAKRVKYTYSPVYFKLDSAVSGNISSIDVEAYGYDGNKYQHTGDMNNLAKRHIINKIGKYSIVSYIHELGYPEATVALHSRKGAGVLKGAWSPDSASTYTILK